MNWKYIIGTLIVAIIFLITSKFFGFENTVIMILSALYMAAFTKKS